LRYVFKDKSIDKLSLIGFSCILGGGFANIYDRILYGTVTDFLHIDLGGVFRTGIFNLADLSVTTGMIMILTAGFIHRTKK
jgi:signal peptidase II